MRNLKINIEYDGTHYCGWQAQNSSQLSAHSLQRKTIQATIEKALQEILREKVRLVASGRTDAGVHALGQVANFKTTSPIDLERLHLGVNALLPRDIAIKCIEEVPLKFHSRFNAKSKIYRYTIFNRKFNSPLLRHYAKFCFFPLDLGLMRREAKYLLGRHNFKAFQASDGIEKNPFRTVKMVKISRKGEIVHIEIEADGFLYNMARNIVGTLIEIGRGRFPPGSMQKILRSKSRSLAGPTAQACGLCLIEVKY